MTRTTESGRARLFGSVVLAGVLAAGVATAAPVTYGYTGSLQSFTAAEAGNYVITAFGAQGGSFNSGVGGLGAEAQATFMLSSGQTLNIVVGGTGTFNGGGGGSFVFSGSGATATPLVIAGGGGGASGFADNGTPGQVGPSGSNGGSSSFGPGGAGGVNGQGGAGGTSAAFAGGGGGGFFGGGGTGQVNNAGFVGGGGGQAASAGAGGGAPGSAGPNLSVGGGYGGGGGGGAALLGGGGGGGYGGGGGGVTGGGGGGSFLASGALNMTLLSGVQTGNGLVTVEEIVPLPTTVPEPASFAVLGLGVAGLLGWRRRQGV